MITLVYAGLLTLMGLYLAYRTATKRGSTNILIGQGEDLEMLKTIRVHGNFTEYTPFFLILLGALEYSGQVPMLVLYILGDTYILARIAHAYGITKSHETTPWRFYGILFTWLVLAVQSVWAIWIYGNWAMGSCFGFCS